MELGILLFVFWDSLEFFFLAYCLKMWLFRRKNWGPSCIPDFSLVWQNFLFFASPWRVGRDQYLEGSYFWWLSNSEMTNYNFIVQLNFQGGKNPFLMEKYVIKIVTTREWERLWLSEPSYRTLLVPNAKWQVLWGTQVGAVRTGRADLANKNTVHPVKVEF